MLDKSALWSHVKWHTWSPWRLSPWWWTRAFSSCCDWTFFPCFFTRWFIWMNSIIPPQLTFHLLRDRLYVWEIVCVFTGITVLTGEAVLFILSKSLTRPCVWGDDECVFSQSHWSQHQAADLLSTGSTLSHIHTELRESPSITPPVLHLLPWDLTIVPQAISAFMVRYPLLSQRALWLAESVRTSSQTQTHTFKWRCGTINRREEPAQIRLSLQRLPSTHIQPWHLQSLQLSPVLRSIWLWATRWVEDPRTFKYG